MSIDTNALLTTWTQLAVSLRQDGPEALSDSARDEVLTCLHTELESAFYVFGENGALGAHANRVAGELASKATSENLGEVSLKLEASSLGLALLSTCQVADEIRAAISINQLGNFMIKFVKQSERQYIAATYDIEADPAQPVPTGRESLQHAVRSPLQGAMLTLELIREDLLDDNVTLDDVDAVIKSLKTVSHLLGSNRDTEQPG